MSAEQNGLWENAVRGWGEDARKRPVKASDSSIKAISSRILNANREREVTPSLIVYCVWPLFSRGGYADPAHEIWEKFMGPDDPSDIVRHYLPTQNDFLRQAGRVSQEKLGEYGKKPLRRMSLIACGEDIVRMASVIYPDGPSRTKR